LRGLFLSRRPDVVHTHQSKAGILGRAAAWAADVPLIVHGVHILPFLNAGFFQKMVYLGAEKLVANCTDAYISVSEGMRQACLQHRVGKTGNHFIARSGMDLSRFGSAQFPVNWRQMVGISAADPKPPVILMLAALEPRKRHVEFLRVFRQVLNGVPEARLLLAGEGPARPAIEAEITRLGLQHRVALLGFEAEPERLLALADLSVLTSMREGLPRVAIQSLASGKPLVASRLPGIDEIVKDGVNGVVTPSDDLSATAAAIVELLRHPAQLKAMQREAAQTDVRAWSIEAMCETISGVYELLVAQNIRLKAEADIVGP
jgi:glycosyltransferase involved in cell wall biosynthesis